MAELLNLARVHTQRRFHKYLTFHFHMLYMAIIPRSSVEHGERAGALYSDSRECESQFKTLLTRSLSASFFHLCEPCFPIKRATNSQTTRLF